MGESTFSREWLQAALPRALRAWHSTKNSPENLLESLVLVQERREKLDGPVNAAALRLATNEVLTSAIDELESQDETAGRVLRMRFQGDNKIVMVAYKLSVSEHTVSRLQRAAVDHLAEIISFRELQAREDRAQALEAQIPPATYTRLFGFDEAQTLLLERLLAPDSPWVVAIVGMGGIGKTALADAVTRRVIRTFYFDRVIWNRAQVQTMSGRAESPQLAFEDLISRLAYRLDFETPGASSEQQLIWVRRKLKSQPILVIVDNLETTQETVHLLNQLGDLADPSKFLLTSRVRPPGQTSVFHFSLSELPLSNALELLRHHAADIGVTALDEAPEADLRAIYQLAGGNPLALKLVVSLLDVLPLPQVMEDLMRSRPGPVEDLYRHIYWQAWQTLSPEARALLQIMPLVAGQGALPDYLQSISGLTADQFWPALHELRSRSLLEVRGTIQQKRYGVHRLTETFVRTEIVQLPVEDVET